MIERPNNVVYSAFVDEYEKIALDTEEKRLLKGVDSVRPYAYRGLMGAVPGAVLGSSMFASKAAPRIGALVGAGIGVADKALEDLAAKRKYKKLLTSYRDDLSTKVSSPYTLFERKHVGGTVTRGLTDHQAEKKLKKSKDNARFGRSIKEKLGM
jgi:hypothetical protein